jgi:CBS domain containing-hemolysin-like protein
MALFFTILLLIVLILLNGFFVAAEYSLVTLRKTRVDELAKRKNKSAVLIQKAQHDLSRFISATQLGVTITSLAVGWLGEPVIAKLIEPELGFLPHDYSLYASHTVAVVMGFLLITYVHVVIGELLPKAFALQRTEPTATMTIAPLTVFALIFKPFIWLLDTTSTFLLKLFGLSANAEGQGLHSQEEVSMILSQSGQSGIIPQDEVAMASNAFKLGDTPVSTIMLPRTDIIGLEYRLPVTKVMQIVNESPHSRFPVYKNSLDRIIGYVHIKDIYRAIFAKESTKLLKDLQIIRDILTVPVSKPANDVLLDMQRNRVHMAVVADEFGGTEGIVTLEDIIESLVGEIYDEFEEPERHIRKQSDGSFSVDGRMTIDEVQSKFKLPVKGHGYTTIGGLVFGLLGHEPAVGDTVQIGGITIEITQVAGNRIKRLKIKRVPQKKQ